MQAHDPSTPRTVVFLNTYLQKTLYEWNILNNEINICIPLLNLKECFGNNQPNYESDVRIKSMTGKIFVSNLHI